jgi:pimeloyl-ACP methyl ester carboxylesterase
VIRTIVALLGSAAGLYLAFLACLFIFQRTIIYPGTGIVVPTAPPSAPGLEVVNLQLPSGSAETLFLPAMGIVGPAPVMIFAHGNGEVTDFWVDAFTGFRNLGIGVLLVEYPGYGRSLGAPSERSLREAVDAAYDHIAADPRVDKTRIFGFGRSLGGGAICILAHDRPLRALILESTFPSLSIFAARYWAPSFLLRDRFNSAEVLEQYGGTVLVIHGEHDKLIPWEQGKRLADASTHSQFKLYDCGHGCWDPNRLPFWKDAIPFLTNAGILRDASGVV